MRPAFFRCGALLQLKTAWAAGAFVQKLLVAHWDSVKEELQHMQRHIGANVQLPEERPRCCLMMAPSQL